MVISEYPQSNLPTIKPFLFGSRCPLLWQFSGTGKIEGIGNVDNISSKSYFRLSIKFFSLPSSYLIILSKSLEESLIVLPTISYKRYFELIVEFELYGMSFDFYGKCRTLNHHHLHHLEFLLSPCQ